MKDTEREKKELRAVKFQEDCALSVFCILPVISNLENS